MDLVGLIPSFGSLLFTAVAFVAALSVIVAVHEYGHYIVGRWSGIRAEVFSLGFGPVLWQRTDRRGTQWQVAALPLGGYVKFMGDANAASAPDGAAVSGLTPDERRMTMQGAPLWARAATVAAGPVFNFILSILVFGAVIMGQGTARDPLTVAELNPLPFQPMELRAGDQILAIAGQEAPSFDDFQGYIDGLPVLPFLDYTVLRDGGRIAVTAPHPRTTLILGVQPQSAAMEAGLRAGDVITAIDSVSLVMFETLRDMVGGSDGRALALTVWRDGAMFDTTLTPKRVDLPLPEGGFETRWLIGITGGMFFVPETRTPGVVEALGGGATQTLYIARSSLSAIYHMATGAISTCNLRGPLGIAETSGDMARQGTTSFLWLIAVLSTAVGLLNLFPIPVLDGGHLVFHAWEAATGRPPSDAALRILMGAGLALLLTFMAFALTNDLFCP